MTVGEKIRDLRLKNNMTMEELAALLGVQRSAVNKYEKGIVVNLKRSTIVSLCRVFSVPSSYFLDDDPAPNPSELVLIEKYRAADPGTQAAVRKLLDMPDQEQKTPAESSAI